MRLPTTAVSALPHGVLNLLMILALLAPNITAQPVKPERPVVRPPSTSVPPPKTTPPEPPPTPITASEFRSIRSIIDYDVAADRLGDAMPTGQGIAFAHVEGTANDYKPDLTGPAYDSVALSLRSGPSEPNAHATKTAAVIYGRTGLAPGVEVVHCLTTADFLGPTYLNATSTGPPIQNDPTPFPPRVFTHSWIGNPPEPQAAMILRRVDFQIDTRDVVMCVGVNNGRDTEIPALLGSAYNAIAVGTTGGNNSGGLTSVDAPGRCKPDIVAPQGQTSFTTPVVAAVAGLLLEQGDRLVEAGHAGANRSEVIKAALLGGATKPEDWAAPEGQPLDDHLGAGVVNVDRSLRILGNAPAQPGEKIKRLAGWSYPTVGKAAGVSYELTLPIDTGAVAFTMVWNRRIDGRVAVATRKDTGEKVGVWLDAPRLADLDLRLFVVDDDGNETVLAASTSAVDNVEHLSLPRLPQGTYRLELFRDREKESLDEDWQVALAWVIDKPGRE